MYTNTGISSTVSIEVDMCESVGCILLSYDNKAKNNIMCKTIILFIQHWKGFSTETVKLERPFVFLMAQEIGGNTQSHQVVDLKVK